MPGIEYLDPEIANEGESANNWAPGAWINSSAPDAEEYQPDIEPPHIPDYAMLKKHKHYKQYFRPYRYQAFPAIMYHRTLGEKIVKIKEEVIALGPDWSPTPIKPRIDMTGKSLPHKTDTQRLTEALVAGMADKKPGADPTAIAAIVSAVMAAMNGQAPAKPKQNTEAALEHLMPATDEASDDEVKETVAAPDVERQALIELAEKDGVKIDKRWSNQRIKGALGLE